MAVVDWKYSPSTSRGIRLFTYLALGALVGLPIGAILSRFYSPQIQIVEFITSSVVLLIAPVVFFLVWMLNEKQDSENRSSLDFRLLVLASIIEGVIFSILGTMKGPSDFFALGILFLAFGGPAIIGIIRSEGTIDTESNILKYSHDEHEVDISDISGITFVILFNVSFARLSYDSGKYTLFTPDIPRFLTMSAPAANTLEKMIQSGIEDEEKQAY